MKTAAIFLSVITLSLSGFQHSVRADWGPPPQATAWVLESAEYSGQLEGQIARLQVLYRIEVLESGQIEIPLSLPGATITEIKIERSAGKAHIMPRRDHYALLVQRKGRYEVRVEFSRAVEGQQPYEGIQFGIPQATFSTLELFIPRQDVEVRENDKLYVERDAETRRDGVLLKARLGAANQVDMRWSTRPSVQEKVEPVITAEVYSRIALEDAMARLRLAVEYRITQGSARSFKIKLPHGLNVMHVRGSGIRDWHVSDDATPVLEVMLNFDAREAIYRLIVEGEQSIEDRKAEYILPAVEILGVKSAQGYVAVARQGNIEITPLSSEGISRIDVRELPAAFAESSTLPVSLAYRYYRQPHEITVSVIRHEDHPVLAAIAEEAQLDTVYSRQGQLLTRARYAIRSNKKQFLQVKLPGDAVLWSCLVGGHSVKPVHGESHILVPLQDSGAGELTQVELVYLQDRTGAGRIGALALEGPILDVPTTVANWDLHVPGQVYLVRTDGNLDRGRAQVAYLDDPVAALQQLVRRNDRRMRVGQKRQVGAAREQKAASPTALDYSRPAAFSGGRDAADDSYEMQRFVQDVIKQGAAAVETTYGGVQGIHPLKIRIPRLDKVYSFSRVVSSQESLQLKADYVRFPETSLPLWGMGLGAMLVPLGGIAFCARRRA